LQATSQTPNLSEWLERLEQRSPEARVDLGLDRVQQVLDHLKPDLSRCVTITVGGTNGKGSCVSFLESIYRQAGHRCLAFTSPHLLVFAERFRLNGNHVEDGILAQALSAVELARGDIQLTYFEHIALAAFFLADVLEPSVLILEVGLGGRLDAVNAVDADVSIITSIDLDHQQWLGQTRSDIAREKSGIARAGRPLILAEQDPPAGMLEGLIGVGANIRRAGQQLNWQWRANRLDIQVELNDTTQLFNDLEPGIPGHHQGGNLTAAIAAVLELRSDRHVSADQIHAGVADARLPGRFQKVLDQPMCVVDVAHNPSSARSLRDQLQGYDGRSLAVFAALGDKPIEQIVKVLDDQIDHWFFAGLDTSRGLSAEQAIERIDPTTLRGSHDAVESVEQALDLALAQARTSGHVPPDRIIVFGSFLTAAAAISHLKTLQAAEHYG